MNAKNLTRKLAAALILGSCVLTAGVASACPPSFGGHGSGGHSYGGHSFGGRGFGGYSSGRFESAPYGSQFQGSQFSPSYVPPSFGRNVPPPAVNPYQGGAGYQNSVPFTPNSVPHYVPNVPAHQPAPYSAPLVPGYAPSPISGHVASY